MNSNAHLPHAGADGKWRRPLMLCAFCIECCSAYVLLTSLSVRFVCSECAAEHRGE